MLAERPVTMITICMLDGIPKPGQTLNDLASIVGAFVGQIEFQS